MVMLVQFFHLYIFLVFEWKLELLYVKFAKFRKQYIVIVNASRDVLLCANIIFLFQSYCCIPRSQA